MKDNFSSESDKYAKFRPTYPTEFFNYLNSIIKNKKNAWDCGTGNGQIANELSKTFENVYATDISKSQIENALTAENINYSIQSAESTNFKTNMFDLIIVGQAIHWFNFSEFYNEVKRTAKTEALLCVVGYSRVKINTEIDNIITNFYTNIIGKYWDDERKYIDQEYKTIPFVFEEIQTPKFNNHQQWTLDHLIGYLNTWSAVKHFIKENNINPVEELEKEIKPIWGDVETREIHFPLLLRIGKVIK